MYPFSICEIVDHLVDFFVDFFDLFNIFFVLIFCFCTLVLSVLESLFS